MDMEQLVSLCRRRGFIFQSSEIYGGINGFWDYGPLGVELKKNIKDVWWQDMVRNPPPGPDGKEITMVGMDCSIIMNPKVWEASGHVGGFSDPMVACKAEGCKKLFRADQMWVVFGYTIQTALNFFENTEVRKDEILAALKELRSLKNKPEEAKAIRLALASAIRTIRDKLAPDICKSTIASGKQEALELAAFTKKEKELHPILDEEETDARPFLEFEKSCPGIAPCPNCGKRSLTEPRAFNLMFESHAGAVQTEDNKVYLRPETAQGMFANFRNVLDSCRVKLPFGIAQVGKAFRNEINPRNFIFRSREFEQMEIEFFCHPNESMKWYEYWRDLRKKWYSTLGIKSANLIPREQGKEELAFYSLGTTDIEYMFPFSSDPQELEGVAHRGSYDLTAHMKHSGKDLSYFDEQAWNADSAGRATNSYKEWLKTNPTPAEIEKYQYVPHVIEPSAGADRFTLAVLCEAYTVEQVESKGKSEERTVMKFHPRLAPVKAAILPLVNKDGMPEKAEKLYRELKGSFKVEFDDGGAVGRRYRRQDEIGTPFCITIDGETLTNDSVTIRDRDTLQQRRVPIGEVEAEIRKALK